MLLNRFELTNFLSHRSTSIDLSAVNVFVGPCNSGKSAVFDGLLNLAQLASGRISQAFSSGPWSYLATLNRQASPNGQIAFGATFSENEIRYEVSYRETRTTSADDPRYELLAEKLSRGPNAVFDRALNKFTAEVSGFRGAVSGDTGLLAAVRAARNQSLAPDLRKVAADVSRIVKFRLEPSNLKRVGDIDLEYRPRLRPRGERLASVLFYNDQQGQLEPLNAVLREVLPGFEGFEFNTSREQDVGFSVRFSDGRGRVSAARLSDGTLHFIGLAALLLLGGDDLPALLCLEEPEVGLNSSSMRKLVELIRSASSYCQILVSTHSPYLLTELWNHSEVNPFECFHYVTIDQTGDDAGFSHVRPMSALAKSPSLRRAIDVRAAARLLDGVVTEETG